MTNMQKKRIRIRFPILLMVRVYILQKHEIKVEDKAMSRLILFAISLRI
jgi:hypothetical protein